MKPKLNSTSIKHKTKLNSTSIKRETHKSKRKKNRNREKFQTLVDEHVQIQRSKLSKERRNEISLIGVAKKGKKKRGDLGC